MEKLRSLHNLTWIVEALKANGKSIVTTNGTFDLLHYAHVELLQKANSCGDVLIVLVNSDRSVASSKGPERPIIPEQERAGLLAALSCVDFVTIFEEETPLEVLQKLKPHVHVKGGSHIPERIESERALLAQWNGRHEIFPMVEGYATTRIIEKILHDDRRGRGAGASVFPL